MNRNRSIVIFTDRYPYSTGEPFFRLELEYLSSRFEKITIIPFDQKDAGAPRPVPENVEVWPPVFFFSKNKKEVIRKGLFNVAPIIPFVEEFFRSKVWKSKAHLRNWMTHLFVTRSLLNYSKEKELFDFLQNTDLVYFYWGQRWSYVVPFLPNNIKKPVIVRFHGSDLYEHTNQGYIPFRKAQINRLNKAVFISEMGKSYLENRFPNLKSQSILCRLGTSDQGLNPGKNTDALHIVSCSNVIPIKRLDIIANCLSYFQTPVRWTHFGTGSKLTQLESIIKQLPSNVKVDLKGFTPPTEIMEFYRTVPIDIFLNVSSTEGIPVSIMEALSFGIPVIATNVGGTAEIVDSSVGHLADSNITPEMLTKHIQNLISSENYLQLRQNAKKRWAERCNAEKLYSEFVDYMMNI
jgi:glycosyltransferase involved in cell wall biosynthesis